MKSDNYLHYNDIKLHYGITGEGSEVMIAFHGFGQDFFHFRTFKETLSKTYTIYSFDLFFHGNSFWPYEDKPLTKELLKKIIAKFLIYNEIEKFSVMGYSLGGKFVLSILESFPEKINQLILIAPDGIKLNPWYKLVTEISFMRSFFKSLIDHPGRFHTIANILNQLGLINNSSYRFAESQMDTKDKRKRVYFSWMVFRKLKFDNNKIADIINENNIRLFVFLGSHDRIVTKAHIKKFINKVDNYNLKILPSGHNDLIRNVALSLKKNNGFISKD